MYFVDRISQLPEFIIHSILSFLTTEEACRTSILSKRWYSAWASIPLLDFQTYYYKKQSVERSSAENSVQCVMESINKTMQRYSLHKYFIKKLNLMLPLGCQGFLHLIDKWLGIVVDCKIEELQISVILFGLQHYQLPESVFSAKSLKTLECSHVALPYYKTMNLCSLQSLKLNNVMIDELMLERIVASCPLIELEVSGCSGLQNLLISGVRNDYDHGSATSVEHIRLGRDIDASTLKYFIYFGNDMSWPVKMDVGTVKNLRRLDICYAGITDNIVSALVGELLLLEEIILECCHKLKSVKFSSRALKKLSISDCVELKKTTIDAPNLVQLSIHGEPMPPLTVVNVHANCDAQLFLTPPDIDNNNIGWFLKLKDYLLKSNIFKTLGINLEDTEVEIEFEEEMLKQIVFGPHYKLKEVKLHETSYWLLSYTSLSTFLDGVFHCCHPDVLIVLTTINHQNVTFQMILNSLKDKVKCWRHPLKKIEFEAADCFDLLSRSEFSYKFRLFW